MAIEIERKFLVTGTGWEDGEGVLVTQGYLNLDKKRTVRVRLTGKEGFLTIKGVTQGASRSEFEYEIPGLEAAKLFRLCDGFLIRKVRYKIEHKGFWWQVDEFLGANADLVVAEIELGSEDQAFARPDWVGLEVTNNPRYFNSSLAINPFNTW